MELLNLLPLGLRDQQFQPLFQHVGAELTSRQSLQPRLECDLDC